MNAVLRVAAGQDREGYGVGAGLEMRTIGYHMTQYRFDTPWSLRRQDERWIEWTPTWGIAIRGAGLDLRYDGRVTFGTGVSQNGWLDGWRATPALSTARGVDFIPAPNGSLDFDQQTVWTHMVSISLGGR